MSGRRRADARGTRAAGRPRSEPAQARLATAAPRALAALAVLAAVTTLLPLVEGPGWFVDAVVVVVLVGLAGAALDALTPSVALRAAGQLLVAVCTLTALYLPGSAVLGVLPGPDAVDAVARLLEDGRAVIRTSLPPVPDPAGLRLVVVGATAAVAVAVDLLAVRLRRAALAGLPLLAVVVAAGALLRGGLPPVLFVVAVLPYLLLLRADSRWATPRWGRTATRWRRGGGPVARGDGTWGAVAVVVAAALAAALVVPAVGPWQGTGLLALQGVGGGSTGDGSGTGRVDPLLDLAQDLDERSDAAALTYRLADGAPATEPLRLVTVDAFDGEMWRPREEDAAAVPLDRGGVLPEPIGLDVDAALAAGTAEQQELSVSVEGLRQEYLPAPYPATSVDVGDGWLVRPGTLDLVGEGPTTTTEGQTYRVDALRLAPREEDLVGGSAVPPTVRTTWTELPDDLPPQIADLAAEVAGDGVPLQQATRLQAFFRDDGGFSYSEEAPGGTGAGSVAAFLDRRSGYCVHFASAMALMARSLGLPARVSVGFLPGQRQADGSYVVRFSDAHAWPEVYVAGTGWLRFEPTPGVRTGEAPPWTGVAAADAAVAAQQEDAQEPQPAPAPTPAPSATGASPAPTQGAGSSGSSTGTGADARRALLPVAVGVAVVVLLLSPAGLAALLRRRRWRRAGRAAEGGDPAALVDRAEDDLRRGLVDLGSSPPVGATPRSEEARLLALVAGGQHPLPGRGRDSGGRHHGGGGDDLPARVGRLRADQEAARYALVPTGAGVRRPSGGTTAWSRPQVEGEVEGEVGSPAASRGYRDDVDAVLAAVAATTSRRRRWRARWLPLARLRGGR
ncbi:DUF3488 and transglutaminase-like domain-containing protein [Pseudokineococcus basanitobsidens]|uniref:DUF3488 and transglutaminase-like domain-containing protein n=1 Tax=Pseudokineococcus basanitobsidens TaxID=1926649 RepID=A0ABU8RHC4_9ACTN